MEHLAELRRRELETCAGCLNLYLGATDKVPADLSEVVALVLLAVAHELGSLAIETEPGWEHTYTEAAKLVFDRITAPKSLTERQI